MMVKYQAIDSHNKEIPDPGRGKHLWVMMACFQVHYPEKMADEDLHMDMENLLSIDGPGCFKCEKVYSSDLARRFCQGVM